MRTPKMCKSWRAAGWNPPLQAGVLSVPSRASRTPPDGRVWIPSAALRDPPSPHRSPSGRLTTVRSIAQGGAIERQLLQLRRRYRGLQCAQIRGRLADERIVQLQHGLWRWSRLTPNIQCFADSEVAISVAEFSC